jgi:hypothetical protein
MRNTSHLFLSEKKPLLAENCDEEKVERARKISDVYA